MLSCVAQLPDQPRGVPGRAGRQPPLLEQHHILLAELRSGDTRPSTPMMPPPMMTMRAASGGVDAALRRSEFKTQLSFTRKRCLNARSPAAEKATTRESFTRCAQPSS